MTTDGAGVVVDVFIQRLADMLAASRLVDTDVVDVERQDIREEAGVLRAPEDAEAVAEDAAGIIRTVIGEYGYLIHH